VKYSPTPIKDCTTLDLRVRFLIGFLNPKEPENGFYVSSLNRSIQDLSDHGASKEPRNPLWKWTVSVPLTHHDPRDLGLICLIKNTKSVFGFKNPIKKRTISV